MKTAFAAAALAAATLVSLPAMAAVSGFHDSAGQIGVILASEDVANALRQMPVEKVEYERTGPDGLIEWEIESRDCDLSVYLRPQPAGGAGGAPMVGRTGYEIARISRCD